MSRFAEVLADERVLVFVIGAIAAFFLFAFGGCS